MLGKLFSGGSKSSGSFLVSGDHSGFLYKEGGNNKEFRRRFFVLAGTNVSYSSDEAAAVKGNHKGTFTINAIGHIHAASKAASMLEASTVPLCFYLDAAAGRRYLCFAETYEDKVAWLRHVTAALGMQCGQPLVKLTDRFAERCHEAVRVSLEGSSDASKSLCWIRIAEGIRLGKEGDIAAAQVAYDAAVASTEAEGADDVARAYARYEAGRLLLSKGQYAESRQLLEAANRDPCTKDWVQLRLTLAWGYGRADGYRDSSMLLYNSILDDDPLCGEVFLDRAKHYIRSCEWVAALGDFSTAAALGRGDANVYNDIGVCYFEMRQHAQALEFFGKALELDPRHAPSWSNRANCLKNLCKLEEADADYTQAIEIDNTNPKAFLSRALLREGMGQRVQALTDFQSVINLQSQHELALKKVLSLSSDPTENAHLKGWLHKRGHVNPSYQKRYFLLHGAMVSYYTNEDAAKASQSKGSPIVASIAHVRPAQVRELPVERAARAFRFESTEGRTFIVFAETPAEKNSWLTALAKAVGGGHTRQRSSVEKAFSPHIKKAEEAAQGGGGGGGGGGAVDVSEDTSGGVGNAVGVRRATMVGNPNTGWALVARGARFMQAGSQDEARVYLTRAAEQSEGPASGTKVAAEALLGKLLTNSGMHAEAAVHFSNGLRGAPETCKQHVQLQLAWAYWHSHRNADAEALYWEILDDDVLCWQALVDRARMHLQSQFWNPALCDLAQVLAMGKADADACNDLGVAHYESGDHASALAVFTEAIKQNPSHAAAISNRANCLKSQGKLREAEADYTRAIELDGSNPKAFINRGTLLKDQGLTVRAHRDLEKALSLDPTNGAVKSDLEALAEKLKASGIAAEASIDGDVDLTGVGEATLRRERL